MVTFVTVVHHHNQETNFDTIHGLYWASQVALVVKNPPANAGDARDTSSTPKWGRSPGVGNGTSLQYIILAWKIPWTEELGRLQSMGLQRIRHD